MSNTYMLLKSYYNGKNWHSQKFNFLTLKHLPPGQFLGSSNSCRLSLNFKASCCDLAKSGCKTVWLLLPTLLLKGIMF